MDFIFKRNYLLSAILVILAVLQLNESSSLDVKEPFYDTTDSTSCTFRVCDKIPEKVRLIREYASHLASNLYEYSQNDCVRVIQGTNFSRSAGLFQATTNGFIKTVIQCYKGHHNLVIRPDDIWMAIITQFSFYINANAERFRDHFVNFDGKEKLVVELGHGTLDSVSYATFVRLMEQKIEGNIINKEISNWIMPNFTTTTQDDKLAAGVIFMATLKNYFHFGARITCGIPKITLEGTVDDWKNIQQRLTDLTSYDLEKWVDEMLAPILEQFVRAKQGDVDQEFWNSTVSVNEVGCGTTDVSGWITAFNVFDSEGNWIARTPQGQRWPQMDIKSIVSGVVQVNVTIMDDNREIHETVMLAGHMANEILPDGYTLKPKIGWVIALKKATSTESVMAKWLRGSYLFWV